MKHKLDFLAFQKYLTYSMEMTIGFKKRD